MALANSRINKKNVDLILLAAIIVIGFTLRVYRVGEDSFWYDEVGQVEAALQPHIIDTLNIVRSHAGAMPLDYLVTRFMTIFSLHEGVIRLPAVIWGTASIIIYYLLIIQLEIPYKKQVALLTAFLTALSPVNIQYSQEVRFYASLMFFYALSILFLLKAIISQKTKYWLAYLASTVIGIYFHPYVLFTVVIGLFVLGYKFVNSGVAWKANPNRKNICLYSACSVMIVIAFLPGYFFFHAQDTYTYEFGLASDSVLYGIGLKATISNESVPPLGIWHVFLIIGLLTGVFFILQQPAKYAIAFLILTSVASQIIIIMLLDYWNGYPFIPRQVVHFAPFVYLLFSIGFGSVISYIKESKLAYTITIALLAGLALMALPYIELVYDYSKGGTREIARAIIERYKPGSKVATIRAQHETVLRFYLSQLVGEDEAALMTESFDTPEELEAYIQANPEVRFVYLPRDTDADVRNEVVDLNFKLLRFSEDTDFIFVRK